MEIEMEIGRGGDTSVGRDGDGIIAQLAGVCLYRNLMQPQKMCAASLLIQSSQLLYWRLFVVA